MPSSFIIENKLENKLRQLNFINPNYMYKTFFIGVISGESKMYKDRTYLFRTHGKIFGLNFQTEKEDLFFDTMVKSIEANNFSIETMENIYSIIKDLKNDNLDVKFFTKYDNTPVSFDLNGDSFGCKLGEDRNNGIFEVIIGAVNKKIFSDAFLDYSLEEISFEKFKSLFIQDFSLDEVLKHNPIFISKEEEPEEER